MLNQLKATFAGKKIFLTGHTGFKGAWMLQLIHQLGAMVKGYALEPEHDHDLYNQIKGEQFCQSSIIGNLKNLDLLQQELKSFKPDFVFHLGAQSLVLRSYDQPIDTFMVNAIGTAHVLEAMRSLQNPCVGLMITTDKVYENPERGIAFHEEDKLGGYDPYSASKAAAEIVIDSYRRSFFPTEKWEEHRISIAAVRAGNVIGGGDFSKDRIIPDIVNAIEKGSNVVLRKPNSIRPWQHVLEPICGYLLLASKMAKEPIKFSGAYNFGPEKGDEKSVESLTKIFLEVFEKPNAYEIQISDKNPHEANLLLLDSSKAKEKLAWHPKLNAEQAIRWTAEWYADKKQSAIEKCQQQIDAYFKFE